MQRWQVYMASAEADHRVAESLPREEHPYVTPPRWRLRMSGIRGSRSANRFRARPDAT
jgi:hypothetical protein